MMVDLKQIKGNDKLLSEQVAEQIQTLIIDLCLKAGEKLPNEFELARFLDVSRGSIREAVKLLEGRHILETKQGRGTFIVENPGLVDDPFGFAFWEDKNRLARELFSLRWQLEPWIASLAAKCATQKDLEELKSQQRKVEQLVQHNQDSLLEDQHFHTSVADCTHNQVLHMLIPVITYHVRLPGQENHQILNQDTITSYAEVTCAIAAHDSERAQSEMKKYLHQVWLSFPFHHRFDLETL